MRANVYTIAYINSTVRVSQNHQLCPVFDIGLNERLDDSLTLQDENRPDLRHI